MKTKYAPPQSGEFGSYYASYISKVAGHNVLEVLRELPVKHIPFFKQIPSGKWDYRYASGKWNIKEILVHLLDTERIFTCRALRIARGDTDVELPGFDQDQFVRESNASIREPVSLIHEYELVRKNTLSVLEHLSDKTALRIGQASGYPVSPRAIGYIIAGHEIHHVQILKERYLQ